MRGYRRQWCPQKLIGFWCKQLDKGFPVHCDGEQCGNIMCMYRIGSGGLKIHKCEKFNCQLHDEGSNEMSSQ